MQIHCTNCGTLIKAENINIQERIAVCSACDTVFKFDIAEEKAKRRKLKQPQNLILRDAETLQMQFRTNWRMDRDEGFVASTILGGFSALITAAFLPQLSRGLVAPVLPLSFALVTIGFVYMMALVAYNHTELEMDEEAIRVKRAPLPSLRNTALEITVSGIDSIYAEETPRSIKEAFDTPRYHVWAKMLDGSRKVIVQDLVEDYAYFVAQTLDERLHETDNLDVARLEDKVMDELSEETGRVAKKAGRS